MVRPGPNRVSGRPIWDHHRTLQLVQLLQKTVFELCIKLDGDDHFLRNPYLFYFGFRFYRQLYSLLQLRRPFNSLRLRLSDPHDMSLRGVFITLAILAVFLLHGVFRYDGGTEALVTHANEGRFSNGKTLHRVYTGYPIIDHILPMSVSFWDPVLYQSRPTLLLSRTFSASVQSLGVFAMVESRRKGCKNIILRW